MVQVPNFTPGVGRLTADRYDFQHHVDGSAFQHHADSIVLNPAISVNGGAASTDLQAVITQINALVPQVIPDATNSTKGLIKLTGDLGGTSSTPAVTGLRGSPISTSTPNDNDVLTYIAGVWTPTAQSNNPTYVGLVVTGNTTINGFFAAEGGYDLNGTGNFSIAATGAITIQPSTALNLSASNLNANFSTASVTSTGSLTLGAQNVIINSGLSGLTINGSLVTINPNLTVGTSSANTMTVASTTNFQNNVTIGTDASSSLLIKSVIGSSGQATTIAGVLSFSGTTGRILFRGTVLANTNQTVSVINIKYFVAPSSLTATHTYTLTDTGVFDSDWFQFYNESLFVQNLTGAVSDAVASGGVRQFVRIGGNWVKVNKPT